VKVFRFDENSIWRLVGLLKIVVVFNRDKIGYKLHFSYFSSISNIYHDCKLPRSGMSGAKSYCCFLSRPLSCMMGAVRFITVPIMHRSAQAFWYRKGKGCLAFSPHCRFAPWLHQRQTSINFLQFKRLLKTFLFSC